MLTASGNDETNDCPLPKTPSVGAGGFRIYPLHDDLELHSATGRIYYQYFPESPHSVHRCGVHVITWHDVFHEGTTNKKTFSFQALLFDNLDILFQYGPGNPEQGEGSTTGIQNATASIGLNVTCNEEQIPDDFAILIQPPVIVVTTSDDELDTPAGTAISLREAVRDSLDGGRIEFASGMNQRTTELASSEGGVGTSLGIDGKSLAIDASALSEKFHITGSKTTSHFTIRNAGWLSLDNLSLEQASASGSTYLADSSGLVACYCRWLANRDSSTDEGGAISMLTSKATVKNAAGLYRCDFIDNSASLRGGAISVTGDSRLRAEKCRFWSNKTPDSVSSCGGAIYLANARVELRECDIATNIARLGGGIYASGGVELEAIRCTFDDNRAQIGGGVIYNGTSKASSGLFRYCTFFGNCASAVGGAIAEASFIPPLDLDTWHCTFYKNVAWSGGGAFSLEDATCHAAAIIMADNGNDQLRISGSGALDGTMGDNLETGNEANFAFYWGQSDITAGLTDLGNHGGFVRTCMLLQESDAIDAAVLGVRSLASDARGLPTFRDGGATGDTAHDSGAVEIGPTLEVTHGADSGSGSLQVALNGVQSGGVVAITTSDTINLPSSGFTVPASRAVFVQGYSSRTHVHNLGTHLNNRQALALYNIDATADAPATGITTAKEAQLTTHCCTFTGFVVPNRPLLELHGANSLLATTISNVLIGPSPPIPRVACLAVRGVDATMITRDCLFQGCRPMDHDSLSTVIVDGSSAHFQRCSLVDNIANPTNLSGGVIVATTSLTIGSRVWLYAEGNTIVDNHLSGSGSWTSRGGGLVVAPIGNASINVRSAFAVITNNTIASNRSTNSDTAAGFFINNNGVDEVTLTRNIIAKNSINVLTDGVVDITSGGDNLSDTAPSFFTATDIPYVDPLLGPAVFGPNQVLVCVPRPGSPCIDAAGTLVRPDSGCLDGRGLPRAFDGDGDNVAQLDIGAVESGRVLAVTTDVYETDGLGKGAGNSLHDCMDAAATFGNVNIGFDPSLDYATLEIPVNGSSLTLAEDATVDLDGRNTNIEIMRSDLTALFQLSGTTTLSVSGLHLNADTMTNQSGSHPVTVATYAECRIRTSCDFAKSRALVAHRDCDLTGRVFGPGHMFSMGVGGERRIHRCTFHNITGSGHILNAVTRSRLLVSDSTFANNAVSIIESDEAAIHLLRSTITRNGGGLVFDGTSDSTRPCVLRECLMANNAANITGTASATSTGRNHLDFTHAGFSAALGDRQNRAGYLAPLADYDGDGRMEAPLLATSASFNSSTGAPLPSGDVITVTTTANQLDSPAGAEISLREALRDISEHGTIVFDASLNNKTFNMGSTLAVDKSLTIDATSLPLGIDLTTRLSWTGGQRIAMRAVHMRDITNSSNGGAISCTANGGAFIASHCAFSGNNGNNAGAIYIVGADLVLENCTFSANTSTGASAIAMPGSHARIEFCTFGEGVGGLTADTAAPITGAGPSFNSLDLYASVFFDNFTSNATTLAQSVATTAALKSRGYNMFPDSPTGAHATDAAGLTFLGGNFMDFKDYGFGTAWVPSYETLPLVGAPIDSVLSSGLVPPEHDARGLTRPARSLPDAGAHEWASELEDTDMDLLPDWWELLQGLNPNVADDTSIDTDGDGASLLNEFQWRTDPNDAASFFNADLRPTAIGADILVNTEAGYPYMLETCSDVTSWEPAKGFFGTGPNQTLLYRTNEDRRFFRIRFNW